jgi:hypothetical protein
MQAANYGQMTSPSLIGFCALGSQVFINSYRTSTAKESFLTLPPASCTAAKTYW